MDSPFRQIVPTDKFTTHRAYLDVYARLFAPIKDSVWPVLEIGTAGGGGMLMYRDYFRNATIVGIDNNPLPADLPDRENLLHLQRDAYTPSCVQFLEETLRPFCLIVDDGPHTFQAQEWMIPRYCHFLSDAGLLVIEDVQGDAALERLTKAVPDYFTGEAFDLRGVNGVPDDIIFVVKRSK